MRQSRSGGAFSARQSRGRGFPREQQTPEALGALVKADAEKWWPLIKEFWIKADQGRVSQRPVCAKRRITSTTYGDPVSCRPPVHVPAAILSKVVLVDQRMATSVVFTARPAGRSLWASNGDDRRGDCCRSIFLLAHRSSRHGDGEPLSYGRGASHE